MFGPALLPDRGRVLFEPLIPTVFRFEQLLFIRLEPVLVGRLPHMLSRLWKHVNCSMLVHTVLPSTLYNPRDAPWHWHIFAYNYHRFMVFMLVNIPVPWRSRFMSRRHLCLEHLLTIRDGWGTQPTLQTPGTHGWSLVKQGGIALIPKINVYVK